MRGLVLAHPAYRGDSEVSDEIAYDLLLVSARAGAAGPPDFRLPWP